MTAFAPRSGPCPTCPWRRDATPGGVDIPNFSMCMMRNLRSTVGDGSDAIRPIMACHHSTGAGEYACAGYLAVVGWTNIAVRLAACAGRVDLEAIIDACADEGIELFGSFDEMLEASERALS